MESEILSLQEAGALLGCSSETVRRRINDGALPYVRKLTGPNGGYLVLRSEVEKLAEDKSA